MSNCNQSVDRKMYVVPKGQKETIKRLASQRGWSASYLVVKALEQYLKIDLTTPIKENK